MKPLERLHQWRVVASAALLLWLALLATGVQAADTAAMQEAWPVVASAMGADSTPMASDCMPCALCCTAPAPTTQGFSGESKQCDEPVWRIHVPPVPDSTWRPNTGGWRPRLPVRVVYCRWLD